jgi:uncharacterized protein YwgA
MNVFTLGGNRMDRSNLVLAILSASNGAAHTPVQVQKLFFLIDRKIPEFIGGPLFQFLPDDYGPFDKTVYRVLEDLSRQGFVEIEQSGMKRYRLTSDGQQRGQHILNTSLSAVSSYIRDLSSWVRALSFAELVSAIYKEYPDMRANSIFREYS